MTPALEIGQTVAYRRSLERRTEYMSGLSPDVRKTWRPTGDGGEGVLIGLRTFQDGVAEYLGPDVGRGWRPEASVPVALVAPDLHRRAVPVLLEDITPTFAGPSSMRAAIAEWDHYGRHAAEDELGPLLAAMKRLESVHRLRRIAMGVVEETPHA